MKAYLILDFKVTDLGAFMEYVSRIPAFIAKHEGRYLVEGVKAKVIEGNWSPDTIVVLEFASREKAENFLDDPEIAPLFAIRHQSTDSNLVLVNGGSWRDAVNQTA